MELSQVEWKAVGKATFKEFSRDDVPMVAAAMAFHSPFTLFPFAIFLAALTGFIGRFAGERDLFQTMTDYLQQALPQTAWQAIARPLNLVVTHRSGRALSLGVLLALFSASNGVATVMQGWNPAYGIEESHNFILQRLVAIALTVVLTLLLIAGYILHLRRRHRRLAGAAVRPGRRAPGGLEPAALPAGAGRDQPGPGDPLLSGPQPPG